MSDWIEYQKMLLSDESALMKCFGYGKKIVRIFALGSGYCDDCYKNHFRAKE